MREFFSQFGKVIDSTVMLDRETGRSKGFGFVSFEDTNVQPFLGFGNLAIDGKLVSYYCTINNICISQHYLCNFLYRLTSSSLSRGINVTIILMRIASLVLVSSKAGLPTVPREERVI